MNQLKSIGITASLSFLALTTFVVATPGVVADFTSSTAVDENQVVAGTVKVEIVDAAGEVRTTPYFAVTNAAPEMLAQTSSIILKNNGSLDSSIRLSTKDLISTSAASLDDVIRVVIKDELDAILYTGKIGDINIEIPNLAAGESVTWDIVLDWPDLANVDDNPYQASAITFGLQVDASNLVS